MQYILQTDVPRCPQCSALMFTTARQLHLYFCCNQCSSIFQVVSDFNADNEVVISDRPCECDTHLI